MTRREEFIRLVYSGSATAAQAFWSAASCAGQRSTARAKHGLHALPGQCRECSLVLARLRRKDHASRLSTGCLHTPTPFPVHAAARQFGRQWSRLSSDAC